MRATTRVFERSHGNLLVPVVALALLTAGCADDGGDPAPPAAPEPAEQQVPLAERACASREAEPASEGVSGQVIVTSRVDPRVAGPTQERRLRFVLTPCGDARIETRTLVDAHDAVEGVSRSLVTFDGSPARATVVAGVAPAPPDAVPPPYEQLGRAQAEFVVARVAAGDSRVEDVVHDGRPAWRLVTPVPVNATSPEASGDQLEIVVDHETHLALVVRETKGGDLVREHRVVDLQHVAPVAPSVFSPSFPEGAEVQQLDRGFRRVDVADVAGAVGYQPLLPSWLPDGFRLLHVAVADEPSPTAAPVSNPPARDVAVAEYGDGYSSVVVTTRRATGDGASWSDPLGTGPGFEDQHEKATIEGGALDGVPAQLLVVPRAVPHLWATADDLVVTVAGGLGTEQLRRVAGSLARASG